VGRIGALASRYAEAVLFRRGNSSRSKDLFALFVRRLTRSAEFAVRFRTVAREDCKSGSEKHIGAILPK
jgi:hypothetical protein